MKVAKALPLIPLALLLLNSACASAQPTALANSDAASASAVPCAPSGQRVESLRSRRGSRSDAEAAIKWSVSPQAWSLGQVIDVEGRCATSIRWFTPGVGALLSGERFTINESAAFAPNGRFEPILSGEQTRGGPWPSVRGAAFVMASRVNSRGAGNDYVGVWRGATGNWFVAAFSELSDRVYGPIKILVTSVEPILAVSYFPAPDTPSGQIGLVQQTGPDAVRLIAYYWHHRSFFPVR